MGYSLPGSSVHGILQARILERVVSPFFREFSWPRDWTRISCIVDGFFTIWANRQALQSYIYILCHWKITYKTPNCRNFYVTCLYFRVNFLTQTPVISKSLWVIPLELFTCNPSLSNIIIDYFCQTNPISLSALCQYRYFASYSDLTNLKLPVT